MYKYFMYTKYNYMYMCKSTNTSNCISIHVSIPFKIVDYYKNTIGDMQNKKYFYGHYNECEYNHDYVNMMKYSYIYISKYIKYNYTYLCKSIFQKR